MKGTIKEDTEETMREVETIVDWIPGLIFLRETLDNLAETAVSSETRDRGNPKNANKRKSTIDLDVFSSLYDFII